MPAGPRVVDVLVHLRTSRFDRPLSYALPDGLDVRVGDVVRVPLGPRAVYAYVLGPARSPIQTAKVRVVIERVDVPRAFDALGLALARWMAERYVCSLRDALGAVVLADAVPRVEERYVPVDLAAQAVRFPSVPPRFARLLAEEFAGGFTLATALRHPEARRAGDRKTLTAAVSALVRGGALRRERIAAGPRTSPATHRVLVAADGTIGGAKAAALLAYVRERGEVPRADARLAGFSSAVIARAIATGVLHEEVRALVAHRNGASANGTAFVPTVEQAEAIARIDAMTQTRTFGEALVYGVTGSGKTAVYIEAIRSVVARGCRAIVLVPEIALTPQTARRFEAAFGDHVAVLHSALSARERYDAWQAAARGEVDVVVGARSAVFAPLRDVGLLVIDEAHETSYKQDSPPRYDTLAVARERMRRERGVLVLGSATPPLEEYGRALAGAFPLLVLRERATGAALPPVRVVDMRAHAAPGHRPVFSPALVAAMRERLDRGEKTILFVNRRGSASFVLCRACGFVPTCPRCSTSLVEHRTESLLRCHYCDFQAASPHACPSCGQPEIGGFGLGTQRVAEEAAALFQGARILRMDSDTTTRIGDHARILDAFERAGDVLVGTQMVAKGLDFPSVTLAAVVAADIGLHIPDFRAAERAFALIAQVSGRSGRAGAGEAIVQTYSPDHPAIVFAAQHDFDGFARGELAERRVLGYPPFGELAYVGVIGREEPAVAARAAEYAELLREARVGDVLGPVPYPIARLNEEWRYRLALRGYDLAAARRFLRERLFPQAERDPATRLVLTIDP